MISRSTAKYILSRLILVVVVFSAYVVGGPVIQHYVRIAMMSSEEVEAERALANKINALKGRYEGSLPRPINDNMTLVEVKAFTTMLRYVVAVETFPGPVREDGYYDTLRKKEIAANCADHQVLDALRSGGVVWLIFFHRHSLSTHSFEIRASDCPSAQKGATAQD